MNTEKVLSHFKARAAKYNASSRWCTDSELLGFIYKALSPAPAAVVLDAACGTGLVAQSLKGKVRSIVGLDITEEMYRQGRKHTDYMVHGSAERIPFKSHTFDAAIERQGIQFMHAPRAVSEMVRVTRPGGKICLVQLCAYGPEDREEYFRILGLRNPARQNFFMPDDLGKLLTDAGCASVDLHAFVSPEDVDVWADNGAIGNGAREEIRNIYRQASPGFNKFHAVRIDKTGQIIDHMLFCVAVGTKT